MDSQENFHDDPSPVPVKDSVPYSVEGKVSTIAPPHDLPVAGRFSSPPRHFSQSQHSVENLGSPRAKHNTNLTMIQPTMWPSSIPPGVARSMSLSPKHLISRRRVAPSLLVSGPNMSLLTQPASATDVSDEVVPTRFSEHQKAMERAVATERKRAKEMEANEKDLSADELRKILKQERHRMASFARIIADLKTTAVQGQLQAEIHEEGRINSLLSHIESMQVEKGRIIHELEREEEMLTNKLWKKLEKVTREKAELEKLLERDQKHSRTNYLQSTHEATDTSALDAEDNPAATENHTSAATIRSSSLDALEEGDDEETSDLNAVLPDLAAQHADP